jgi:putative endonuclease
MRATQPTQPHPKDTLGKLGEELAARHLTASGLVVLDRNWRCARGEIDVIAVDGRALVFVEVKTRTSVAFGDPAEAVTPAKAARLRLLAAQWLADRRAVADLPPWRELRFDVVCVLCPRDGTATVRHIRAAL